MKRVAITDPVDKRVSMINGYFELPDQTKQAMTKIREASETYANELQKIFKSLDKDVDTGRAIATIDLVQQTKNVACDALILPHASRKANDDE